MKIKKTLRSILCMLVAVCVSLGLFGTVPVKAEDELPEYSYWTHEWYITTDKEDAEGFNVLAGDTRQLTAHEYYSYYNENDEFIYSKNPDEMDAYTWSVSSYPDTANAATITESGLLTFSENIEEECAVYAHISTPDDDVVATLYFRVYPKYVLSRTITALRGTSAQMPELKMYSIDENGSLQTSDVPDTLKLQKVETADKNIVTIDDTGLITPVSTTAGDQTTCTAYYTDGTTEFKRTFTCYITSKTDSDIISNISTDNKLYIYSWDSNFDTEVDLFTDYYPEYADLIEFKNIDVGGLSDDYMEAIDAAAVSDSEPASLFVMDESIVSEFTAKDYVVPLSDIGYKDSWYENAFDFTKSWGSVNGELTALSYSICPGLFYYNAAIAEDVFGTSDPDDIQEIVKDWDSFKDAAKKLKEKGYYILSSAEDMKCAVLNSGDALVSGDTYYLGGTVNSYLEYAKDLIDSGYVSSDSKDIMWGSGWADNMTNGKVFAYFGTTWFEGSMQGCGVNNIYKVCEGPSAYKWGGEYLAATKACTNKGLAQLFLYTITADETFTNLLSEQYGVYPNNKTVAKKLADEGSLGYYSTLNSPFSALYNNAVKLQISEAYPNYNIIYMCINDGLTLLRSDDKPSVSEAIEAISGAIKNDDPDAVISTEAPPHTHQIVNYPDVAATCTTDGYTGGTYCKICGQSKPITERTVIKATGHTIVTDAAVAATCTKTGLTEGSHCSTCNEVIKAQETIPATGNHDYKTSTTAATTAKDGKTVKTCSVCGESVTTATIYKAKTVKLAKTTYAYTGKAIKPSVTVKDSKGKAIDKSNYTVTYPSSCKNVGTYTVTIKFKGNYSGTKKLTYTIQPKATKLSSVKAGSKSFTAKWSKQKTQTTGYQIQYSTSSKFTKATTKTVKKNSTTSLKVSKLTKGKKYYVRIRTYKTVKVNGKNTNIYSSWSSAKKVTVK